jgi:hypothetical protein
MVEKFGIFNFSRTFMVHFYYPSVHIRKITVVSESSKNQAVSAHHSEKL